MEIRPPALLGCCEDETMMAVKGPAQSLNAELIKWEPLIYEKMCTDKQLASTRDGNGEMVHRTRPKGNQSQGARVRVGFTDPPLSPCHSSPFLAHPASPLPSTHGNPDSKGAVSKGRAGESLRASGDPPDQPAPVHTH